MAPVQRFEPNPCGRDWVVGDIHGQFRLLEGALDRIGFDAARDRLFSVGDLIDRGEDSAAALEWLRRDRFHAVRGNHEQMALDARSDPEAAQVWRLNGGEWWDAVTPAVRSQLLQLFETLPIAIEVATSAGAVGIVHADLPEGVEWPRFLERLERYDCSATETALWSRRRVHHRREAEVKGAVAVYCGHTVVGAPLRLGNVHFIDTGAYATGRLTLVPL